MESDLNSDSHNTDKVEELDSAIVFVLNINFTLSKRVNSTLKDAMYIVPAWKCKYPHQETTDL